MNLERRIVKFFFPSKKRAKLLDGLESNVLFSSRITAFEELMFFNGAIFRRIA